MTTRTTSLPEIGATRVDVSDPAHVDYLFEDVVTRMGGLDALINNVGISGPTAPVEDIADEAWESTLAVNITGAFSARARRSL